MLAILFTSSTSLVFSAVAKPLAEIFQVNVVWVNMCCSVFLITQIPFTFVGMYCYKNYPAAWTLRAAALFFVAGAWIRCLSDINKSFIPLLVGNAVISPGYVLLSVAITQIANKWFTDRERDMVIAIFGICIPAGNLVCFVWTGLAFLDLPKNYTSE